MKRITARQRQVITLMLNAKTNLSTSEIANALDLSMALISQSMRIMTRLGIVSRTQPGYGGLWVVHPSVKDDLAAHDLRVFASNTEERRARHRDRQKDQQVFDDIDDEFLDMPIVQATKSAWEPVKRDRPYSVFNLGGA